MKTAHRGVTLFFTYMMLGTMHVYAWNNLGHMVTAFIAYQHLTDPVRTRANALTKQNPFFKGWLKMIPAGASDKTAT